MSRESAQMRGTKVRAGLGDLTERELELLAAYARLGDQQRVADEYGVTYQTAKNTLHHAYEKLDVVSGIEAFTALGWLIPDGAARAHANALIARMRAFHAALGAALNDLTAPGSDVAPSESLATRLDGASPDVAVTQEPSLRRIA